MVNPTFKGSIIETPVPLAGGSSKLPEYVKCYICGKPPEGTNWLKPVTPDPNCRKFIHLSHINDGPKQSAEAGHILRNS